MELNNADQKKKYWDGPFNRFCRYYFYVLRGLDIFNQYRYIIISIIAVCYMINLKHPLLMALIFAVSLPVLGFAGWWQVHKLGKVVDWLNVKFSTHYALYQIDLQERVVKALESIERKTNGSVSSGRDNSA